VSIALLLTPEDFPWCLRTARSNGFDCGFGCGAGASHVIKASGGVVLPEWLQLIHSHLKPDPMQPIGRRHSPTIKLLASGCGLLLTSGWVLLPTDAGAQQTSVQDECFRNTEQYIPAYITPDGRYQNGFVRTSRIAVPCGAGFGRYGASVDAGNGYPQATPRCDRNATIFNGLLGGAIAAAYSKPDSYSWSVPLGLALGVSSSRIGCR
jgi:hypothetical protein